MKKGERQEERIKKGRKERRKEGKKEGRSKGRKQTRNQGSKRLSETLIFIKKLHLPTFQQGKA